jgi:nicotinamidase-related amidase
MAGETSSAADQQRRPERHRERGEGATALVVVDMLNSYEHEDGERLASSVEPTIEPIRKLVARARDEDVPVVYVQDNYGDWNTSAEKLAGRAMEGRHPELVEPILPPEDAAFVVKARHSTFYQTLLEYVLDRLQTRRIVLVGQVTEQCILYSALDAYVRHFQVAVPGDGVAHIYENLGDAALEMMERNMRAEVADADQLRLSSASS